MLEKSKYAYNNKDLIFYGTPKKGLVWVVFHGLTDSQKNKIKEAANVEGIRTLPWPSDLYKEAISDIKDTGFRPLFDAPRPSEISQSILIEMLDNLIKHFNQVVSVNPHPDHPYLDAPFYLKDDSDLRPIFDTMLYRHDQITITSMFDAQRTHDGVWVTFTDTITPEMSALLNVTCHQTVLVSNKVENPYNFSEIINLEGVQDDDLGELFQNIGKRNMKIAQQQLKK